MKGFALLPALLLAGCGGTVAVTQHGTFGPVIFVGTPAWQLPAMYQDMAVVNAGNVTDFQDQVLDQKPEIVVIESDDPSEMASEAAAQGACVIIEETGGEDFSALGYKVVSYAGIEGNYAAMWNAVARLLDQCYQQRTF